MDREVLCESLILWLETFNLDVPHQSADDLSDGVAMAKVLHQIAPDYFNTIWLSKIKSDEVTNWRLKVSNLKKILKGILEYNLEVLGIQIHDFQMPDVNAIGEHSSRGELGRLLQLILGCAVNCSEKQEYIQRIMAMEESVQHVVMTAIQELMTKEMATDAADSEVGEQLKRTIEELNSAIEAKEELMQRCHELDLQVTGLLEEKQSLSQENDKLAERLNQAENLDDPSTPAGKRFQQLQHQLEQLQEEVYKLETAKDDYRIKVDVLQKENDDLKDKNSELSALAEESRSLKDELDVLRHTAEQVVKYEAQIESYKKRMDELSDLRGQVKLLEEKNTKYMQENIELQEDVRKGNTVKQQLEVYKRQLLELQSKLTEETKRADKSDFEAKRIQEKMTTLQREKERIMTERDSLKEVNEELKCTQLQSVEEAGEEISPGLEMLSLPPSVKEKMLRLEHENKMLKLKESGASDEQSQVLQTMLDDANARKNELETDLRLANQKILELEAEVEDLRESQKSTVSSTELVDLKKKLNGQISLVQQKDLLIEKERNSVTELQGQITSKNEKITALQEELSKSEAEMKMMEEKYKKYLDKAKNVIKSLEQRQQASDHYGDVQALRNQLAEKERYIEHMERDQEKAKNIREQEEKLLTAAWYDLGAKLNRQAVEERLANSSTGHSFLARQRQVHIRRPQNIPNSVPNASSMSTGESPAPSTPVLQGGGKTDETRFCADDICSDFIIPWEWLSKVKQAELERIAEVSFSEKCPGSSDSAVPLLPAYAVNRYIVSELLQSLMTVKCKADDVPIKSDNLEENQLSPVPTSRRSIQTTHYVPETPVYQQKSQARFDVSDTEPSLLNVTEMLPLHNATGKRLDTTTGLTSTPHLNFETSLDQSGHSNMASFIKCELQHSGVFENVLRNVKKENDLSFLTTPGRNFDLTHSRHFETDDPDLESSNYHVSGSETFDDVKYKYSASNYLVRKRFSDGMSSFRINTADSMSESLNQGSLMESTESNVTSSSMDDGMVTESHLNATQDHNTSSSVIHINETSDHELDKQGQSFTAGHMTRALNDEPNTPLREKKENIPEHLSSPFILKQHTDLVTKRRPRKKRQRLVNSGNDATFSEDSPVVLKKYCLRERPVKRSCGALDPEQITNSSNADELSGNGSVTTSSSDDSKTSEPRGCVLQM